MSLKMRPCMGRGPYSTAFLTPDHGVTGCGAFHRSAPTGGAANGIPLNVRTLPSALTTPSRTPSPIFCWTVRNSCDEASLQHPAITIRTQRKREHIKKTAWKQGEASLRGKRHTARGLTTSCREGCTRVRDGFGRTHGRVCPGGKEKPPRDHSRSGVGFLFQSHSVFSRGDEVNHRYG